VMCVVVVCSVSCAACFELLLRILRYVLCRFMLVVCRVICAVDSVISGCF